MRIRLIDWYIFYGLSTDCRLLNVLAKLIYDLRIMTWYFLLWTWETDLWHWNYNLVFMILDLWNSFMTLEFWSGIFYFGLARLIYDTWNYDSVFLLQTYETYLWPLELQPWSFDFGSKPHHWHFLSQFLIAFFTVWNWVFVFS